MKHTHLQKSLAAASVASLMGSLTAQAETLSALTTPGDIKGTLETVEKVIAEGPFKADAASLKNIGIPEWYADAKLGIFIHWGVYSVPAFGSEWYPRKMYDPTTKDHKHHVETYGPLSEFGYKDFIPEFTGSKFDADEWAQLFKDSGAKYVMPVAEHHDGFSLYDNSFTRWKSTEMGPKKDIIAELSKSVREHGMKFCVSSHRAFNWAYFFRMEGADNENPELNDLYSAPQPYLYPGKGADTFQGNHRHTWVSDEAFRQDWLARTAELVDKYEPDVIWFDFGIGRDKNGTVETNDHYELNQKFAAYFYNQAAKRGQEVAINYKWNAFTDGEAMLDIERGKLNGIRPDLWQTDTSVSFNSWGYITDHDYKPVNVIVDDLVDIVSKNGVLLLNIGPKADGSIPEHEKEQLLALGGWLKTNGVGIYGSRPWKIYGEGPTENSEEAHSEHKLGNYSAEDIRFTQRYGDLYAWVMDWPGDGVDVSIKTLKTGNEHESRAVESVNLVGGGELKFEQTDEGLVVSMPAEKTGDYVHGVRIRFAAE